jgi:hypothetical protein
MDVSERKLAWIKDGEKFALIGLNVYSDPTLGHLDLPGDLAALPRAAFALPDYWSEWLGTNRVENVEECNLFLLATTPAREPSVVDDESQIVEWRVWRLFTGLTLVSKFTAFGNPIWTSGSRMDGKIDVRRFREMDPPLGSIVADTEPIGAERLREAARISQSLEAFSGPWEPGHWRLLRCLDIYRSARPKRDMLERIHQFTRCVEGLVVAKQGQTKRQFKSRTELFVGPGHHPLMGRLYEVRSDIEHLHEDRYLAQFDRATRIELAKLEAVSEGIARSCLIRIFLDLALSAHFGSVASLTDFWEKPEAERRTIWGAPVDPCATLDGFNFDYVSDEELGAHP